MQDEGEREEIESGDLPRGLARWRSALLTAMEVLACFEIVWPIATWPSHLTTFAFYLYKLGWLVVIGLACAFWTALYRYARAAGGASYAFGYLLLSIVLTPLFFGIAVVPKLVQRDIAGGQAEWQRRTAPSASERTLRTVLYFACLTVVALTLLPFGYRFLLAAPVPAFLLQRLVLPWCRRAERPVDDGSCV